MQVAAAEQQCSNQTEQCGQLQQQLQAAKVATTEAIDKLTHTSDTAAELQRQLTVAVQRRDHFSQLASER